MASKTGSAKGQPSEAMIAVRIGSECYHRGEHLHAGDELMLPASARTWLVQQGVALTDVGDSDSADAPDDTLTTKGDKL